MATDRIQKQIDRLLDEAEQALAQDDCDRMKQLGERVLLLDPENKDAIAFIEISQRALGTTPSPPQLETQPLQSQKMEAIGRLAGGVAHDFNNLLTAIIGYSDLGSGSLTGENRASRAFLEISNVAQRAATLTQQLLTFSRIQSGNPVPVDLNELVLDLDSMLRRLIGADIEFVTMLAQETLTVSVDPGQMEQVVTNLVVNARDAMPDGGKLKLETATTGHDHAVLKVTDSGLGMTDEVRQRIFEPFYTTKEVGEGSGLGLSTSYGIVVQSGGRIDVDSRPDRGSTFSVVLPITEDRPVVSPPEEPEEQNGAKETILLVEDEPTVRSMTSEALRELGYRVLVAKNGVDALSVEETHRGDKIDLLLTDLVMPMLGGGDTAHRIGQRRAGIKVLFTSGFHGDALEDLGAGSSEGQFLPKPFTLDSLATKVREALDG
jgi:signal transduction histidine kinase/ActR/RegA family two-component response regulator